MLTFLHYIREKEGIHKTSIYKYFHIHMYLYRFVSFTLMCVGAIDATNCEDQRDSS